MKIPNYDSELVADKTKHKSLLGNDFRMLVCGSSGCGKTNSLMHIIKKNRYVIMIRLSYILLIKIKTSWSH